MFRMRNLIALAALAIAAAAAVQIGLTQSTSEPGRTAALTLAGKVVVRTPTGWNVINRTADSVELYLPSAKKLEPTVPPPKTNDGNPKPQFLNPPTASMLIFVERRRDHADALRRLADISVEYPEPARQVLVSGWPGIERTYVDYMPQLGQDERDGNVETKTTFTTSAVAVDNLLVRINTMYAPGADSKLQAVAFSMARNISVPAGPSDISQQELRRLKDLAPKRLTPTPGPIKLNQKFDKPGRAQAGVAIQVQAGVGELEVATNDGQNVVVAANSGWSRSINAGGAWTAGGPTPCTQPACDGDPSLAVGASGAIYYAWLGGPNGNQIGDGISRSTDNGATFPFRAMAVNCPGTTSCSVADQEHIAADRFNAATGGDRLYNVWRNFLTTGGLGSIRINCSADGGLTWSDGATAGQSRVIGAGDFPRVAVGRDGFVYVGWVSGGNMMLHKFGTCDSGLTPQTGWPITVSAFTTVPCPVPGLDRCNFRNTLASPVVAPDDLQADHIYYAFATSTGAGNENVLILDSMDGGATFPRSIQANGAVAARRYLSWVSSYGGMAVVSWYDRRTATAANNDRARYYIGGARLIGPNLTALAETDLSGADDNQCSLWPSATDFTSDSESCSIQPQLAGWCAAGPVGGPLTGSFTACDFSSTVCPVGESCRDGRGAPKYGDYNGNAAGGGRMFSAWASSVPPASVGGAGGTLRVYASADRIPSDFYVRDWNAAPNFDNGQQPSTDWNFWSTSDLWNQSGSTAATPGLGGYVVGDAPDRGGSNYLFARVSRRAAAASTAPAAVVTANFFVADYGLGMPYSAVGSQTVTFAAGDMNRTTPGVSWTPAATSSIHLCTAVQISGPDGDVSAFASLAGGSPGTGVVADNNIAQRNLLDTVGTGSGIEAFAIIRNWLPEASAMRLRVVLPKGVRLEGRFEVVGEKAISPAGQANEQGVIDLGVMKPGAKRWLKFRAGALEATKEPLLVHVFDANRPAANGITIRVRRGSLEEVAPRNLKFMGDVFHRLAKLERDERALKLAERFWREAKAGNAKAGFDVLGKSRAEIDAVLETHLKRTGANDLFGVGSAARSLWDSLGAGKLDDAATALNALTERLDAHLSYALNAGTIGKSP